MNLVTIQFAWPVFVRTLRSPAYLDVTQEELARAIGVCVSTVSKWECGVVVPRPRHRSALRRLATRAGYRQRAWPKVARCVVGDDTVYHHRSTSLFALQTLARELRTLEPHRRGPGPPREG